MARGRNITPKIPDGYPLRMGYSHIPRRPTPPKKQTNQGKEPMQPKPKLKERLNASFTNLKARYIKHRRTIKLTVIVLSGIFLLNGIIKGNQYVRDEKEHIRTQLANHVDNHEYINVSKILRDVDTSLKKGIILCGKGEPLTKLLLKTEHYPSQINTKDGRVLVFYRDVTKRHILLVNELTSGVFDGSCVHVMDMNLPDDIMDPPPTVVGDD